jgi:hypothetical protein
MSIWRSKLNTVHSSGQPSSRISFCRLLDLCKKYRTQQQVTTLIMEQVTTLIMEAQHQLEELNILEVIETCIIVITVCIFKQITQGNIIVMVSHGSTYITTIVHHRGKMVDLH